MVSGRELADGHDMVATAVQELLALDPKNELLKYWILKEGENPTKEEEQEVREEFKDKFYGLDWREKPGAEVWGRIYANYYVALDLKVKELKAEARPQPESSLKLS